MVGVGADEWVGGVADGVDRELGRRGLPGDIPAGSGNLGLTTWFLDGHAKERAGSEPWGKDLDAAFYVALFLRAARHSLRYGCPIAYC